jgi:hypothetical protein
MRRNSGIIGPKAKPTITDAGGVNDTFDQYNLHILGKWPYSEKATLSGYSTSINETTNNTVTVTVNTEGFADGTTLYWTISQVSGTVISADFSNGWTGSFSLSGDESAATGSLQVVVSGDGTPDGTDIFEIQVRSGSTSGPILATTSGITIADTSQSGVSYQVDFVECRYGSTMGSGSVVVVDGTTGAELSTLYSWYNAYGGTNWYTVNTNSYSGSPGHRILFKQLTGPNWYSDWQIDNVDINGTVYNFNLDATGWLSPLSLNTSSSTVAFASAVQVQNSSSTGYGRWNRYNGNSTPSSGTGSASPYDGYYLYSEGSSYYTQHKWLYSPIIT